MSQFHADAPQATASEGLAQGPYIADRVEFYLLVKMDLFNPRTAKFPVLRQVLTTVPGCIYAENAGRKSRFTEKGLISMFMAAVQALTTSVACEKDMANSVEHARCLSQEFCMHYVCIDT